MRRNIFEGLTDTAPAADNNSPDGASVRPLMNRERKPPRGSAALGAITQSLGAINEKAQRAAEIERRLAEGQTVVELDPTDVEDSFVRDRMEYSAEDHASLVAAIRGSGQQVPILVRPHPEQPGRYQVAFGHRRLRAVSELGIKVRAVVRELTDEQLIIAQGQENNERTNLSFIEKTRFAARLDAAGFGRDVIMQALCADKFAISRMMAVANRVPSDIIEAVGYAPSIGQRRWQEVADLLDKQKATKVRKLLESEEIAGLSSDQRFEAVYRLLTTKETTRPKPEHWVAPSGARIAKFARDDKRFSLIIDEKAAPEFGRFLVDRLASLYEEFSRQSSE